MNRIRHLLIFPEGRDGFRTRKFRWLPTGGAIHTHIYVNDAPLSPTIYATRKEALGVVEKSKFIKSSTF